MPTDPQTSFLPGTAPGDGADYPDDWYVPTNARTDTYPDDWYVPTPAATPSTGQPAPGAQPDAANPGLSSPPTPRPDPFAAYWSLVPASRAGAMAWHPPIFLNSPGQFPLTAPPRPGVSRIDATGSLLGALANLPATNAPTGGLLGAIASLPSANPAAFPSFQGPGLASGGSNQTAPPSLRQSFANLVWPPSPTGSGAASNADDGYGEMQSPELISCEGPTCSLGGSYGTTGMYSVSGRSLCRDCAVKALGIQSLPAAVKTKILQNFLRR